MATVQKSRDATSLHRPTSRALRPKGPPLKKAGATSLGTSSVTEKATDARGTLDLSASTGTAARRRSTKAKKGAAEAGEVKQFNSRAERSPFLDSAYMELRTKALRAMRERSTA